jgi:hypothetical protein
MAKKNAEKLPFGEKSKRLVELWKLEGNKEKTLQKIGEAYVAQFGGEAPTDQTISAAKYKAFPDLQPATRKTKESAGPTLKNLTDLQIALSQRGVRAADLQLQLAGVQENPFAVYDEAAGGRANLLALLDTVVRIQATQNS